MSLATCLENVKLVAAVLAEYQRRLRGNQKIARLAIYRIISFANLEIALVVLHNAMLIRVTRVNLEAERMIESRSEVSARQSSKRLDFAFPCTAPKRNSSKQLSCHSIQTKLTVLMTSV